MYWCFVALVVLLFFVVFSIVWWWQYTSDEDRAEGERIRQQREEMELLKAKQDADTRSGVVL